MSPRKSAGGPGQYNPKNYNLFDAKKGATFGERREEKRDQSPGPGHYSPEKQAKNVKPKSSKADFGGKSSRTVRQSVDYNHGPGSYSTLKPFGSDSKNLTIG